MLYLLDFYEKQQGKRMKRKLLKGFVTLLIAIGLVGFAIPAGADQQAPWEGHISGVDTVVGSSFPYLFISGNRTGTTTLLGHYTSTPNYVLNLTTGLAEGTAVGTAANGDTMFISISAQAEEDEPGSSVLKEPLPLRVVRAASRGLRAAES